MLRNTRISKMLDTNRLAEALSKPGIDPRIWVSLAVVQKYVVDPAHGPFADVILVPTLLEATARVGTPYGAGGFGFSAKLVKDDQVVVISPSGDPNEGLIVVARLWSAADVPPQEAVDHPDDLTIHVQSGQSLRIIVENGGKVLLGDNEGTDQLVLKSDLQSQLDGFFGVAGTFNTHTHPSPPAPIDPVVTSAPSIPTSSISLTTTRKTEAT